MTFANADTVKTRLGEALTKEGGSVTGAMITDAIKTAEDTINGELLEAGLTPPIQPADSADDKTKKRYQLLVTAANLLAQSDILDNLYNTVNGERSPTAVAKENQAYKKIKNYINIAETDATYKPRLSMTVIKPHKHRHRRHRDKFP